MTIRVVVVDDQSMVREGFSALLGAQPGIEVVGSAADGAEAVATVRALRPDVVLMDVRMPVLDGIEATRQILADDDARTAEDDGTAGGAGRLGGAGRPGGAGRLGGAEVLGGAGRLADAEDGEDGRGTGRPKVLVLTTFDLDDYVYEALRAGASGFLLKDARADELADAVRVVAAGDGLLSPSVTRRIIAEFARRPAPGATRPWVLGVLTPRETEVLSLIAQGLSNTEIATSLVLAEQTVKTHVGRILAKLGLRDRAQAVVAAYESGLVRAGA